MEEERQKVGEEREETGELKKEVEALKRDLLALTHALGKRGKESLAESAEEIKNRLMEKIPKEQLEKMEGMKERGEEVLETLKKQQEAHPVGTVLFALALGFLIGKAWGSGKDS